MPYIHNQPDVIVNKECPPEKVKEVLDRFAFNCQKADKRKDEMPEFRRNQILDEVDKILSGDRKNDYGEASASFKRIADYWNTYLMHKRDKVEQAAHEEDLPYEFLRGEYLTDYDAAMMMILFKIAREENRHKRDNIRDIIGYAVLAEDLSILHTDVEG